MPEQGSGKLIPEGQGKPGHVYTVSYGDTGMLGEVSNVVLYQPGGCGIQSTRD